MPNEHYLRRIHLALTGEMLGEAMLSELAAAAETPEQRHKWASVLQLESETKVRIRPLAAKYGVSVLEDEDRRRQGAELAHAMRGRPWTEMVRGLRETVVPAVAWFRKLEAMGPEADKPILAAMLAHETAILDFLDRELRGEPDSLAPVRAQLQFPLPAA